MSDRLFTPRFFIMCGYSFTVFVSVFQLLPTAPFHILDLGQTMAEAGLFLGCLTYSSAFSAPFTGHVGDRIGQRRVLIAVSLILAVCSASYAFITNYRLMLTVVVIHGLFWSALLSASGAYMTATIPARRRAEGLSYWGLASVISVGAAPAIGLKVYRVGGWAALCWELVVLNLLMAVIAWRLPEDAPSPSASATPAQPSPSSSQADSSLASADAHESAGPRWLRALNLPHPLIEWRVLLLAIAMMLISFGYGGLTSFAALFAEHLQVTPGSLFYTAMALAILLGRLTIGRTLDRIGHRRVLLPALAVPALGLLILSLAQGRASLITAAVVFGSGFGLMYPSFTAYVMAHVSPRRRGAVFGAILAAFDTGVGSGSSAMGWLIHAHGFRTAFGVASAVAILAVPYFVVAERRLGFIAVQEPAP
jgi:MFS family permease